MREWNRDYWPTKEWKYVEPKDVGVDSGILDKLDLKIRADYKNINSILVIRKGYIVCERYFHDQGPNDPRHVASVTKSVISALIDFFSDYEQFIHDRKKQAVTLRHMLTMTAPFAFSMQSVESKFMEPLDRLRRQPDWVKYVLSLMGEKSELGKFQYSTSGVHLLSAIISRVTGMSARELANQYLFGPIGIETIPDVDAQSFKLEYVFGDKMKGWIKDPQGYNVGGWGLTLSPYDMARLGFLYLNGGKWDTKQIISPTWISASLEPNMNNYGYLWWLNEKDPIIFSARGDGGNMICCVPDKDLMVVTTGSVGRKPMDSWSLVEREILPAVFQ